MQAYKLKEVPHSVYQQKSSKDCGGAALLMLFTDVMRKNSSFNLDPEFLKWVAHSYNRNADEIIEQATQKGLQASKESLNKENALSIIQSHIEQTHLPVIVSITHPIIEGHWITVDGIHEGIVYIRDPHSGGAYAIPSETFLSYLDKNIEQCISFRDC